MYFLYFVYFLLSLATASFDIWLGETLFFVFPIVLLYIYNFEKNENRILFYVLLYTIFYFVARFSLNFLSIIFFILFLLIHFILNHMKFSLIKAIIFVGIISFYLSFITSSYSSFIVDLILVTALYFINMRVVFYERKES